MNFNEDNVQSKLEIVVCSSLNDMMNALENHNFSEREFTTAVGAAFIALLTVASELNRAARILASEPDLAHPEIDPIMMEGAAMIEAIQRYRANAAPRLVNS